jgi:hypothetical protein
MRTALLAGLAAVAIAGTAKPQSPSFNCDRARSASQVAICNDGTLARLDSEHERLFSRVHAAAEAGTQARMRREHPMWQRFRDLCGPDRICIAQRYRARIDELKAQANPIRIIGEAPRGEGRVIGRITGVLRPVEVPDLRILGGALGGDRPVLTKPVLTPLEGFAALATQGADPEPEPTVATVDPDGTIKKPLSDGRIAYYNPATDARGYILPDGTVTAISPLQVQPDELPVLPPDYAGWSESVSTSLAGLVGNLLTVAEAETLEANAPGEFFDSLDYQLKILAFITG